jgi:hypothetical protein
MKPLEPAIRIVRQADGAPSYKPWQKNTHHAGSNEMQETAMTMCPGCLNLDRDMAGPAHGRLKITDARKRPGGLSSGVVFLYRCCDCGTLWSRETDSASRESSWVAAGAPRPPAAVPVLPSVLTAARGGTANSAYSQALTA